MTDQAEAEAAGAFLDKMDAEIRKMDADLARAIRTGNPAVRQTGANHGQEAQGRQEVLTGEAPAPGGHPPVTALDLVRFVRLETLAQACANYRDAILAFPESEREQIEGHAAQADALLGSVRSMQSKMYPIA